MLAMNARTGVIIYGVVAALMWILYVAAVFIGERRRAKAVVPPKYNEGYGREVYAYESNEYSMPSTRG